jgi:hypothetical protein
MDKRQQVEVLGSLYLLYKSHSAQLQAAGYTPTEAFWLNFGCLPFLPWAGQSEHRLHLAAVLRLYLGIYQHNTGNEVRPEAVAAFLELLVARYRMAREIAAIEDTAQLERELGRFALPGEHDAARTARAGSMVLHTIAEWRKLTGEDRLPCMLVEDIDDEPAAKPEGGERSGE